MNFIKIIIGILIAGLFCPESLCAKKLAVLPEIIQPEVILADSNQLYIVDGHKIYIYSQKDFRLLKKFGRIGTAPGEFQTPPFSILKISIDVQSENILINSHEKISLYSKKGEFIKDIPTPAQTIDYKQVNNHFVASNYYLEGKTGLSKEYVFLCDANLEFVKQIYQTSKGAGRTKTLSPGKLNNWEVVRDYLGYKVYKDKIFLIDTQKGSFIIVFDSAGNKLSDIVLENKLLNIPEQFKKQQLKKLERNPLYKRFKNIIDPVFPEYFPLLQRFLVDNNQIYIYTYEFDKDLQKVNVLDLEGTLKESILAPIAEYSTFSNQNYFYLKQNRLGEWELHTIKFIQKN